MILLNKAIIFDDTGRYLYKKSFASSQKVFSHNERSYNVNTKASYKETRFFFITMREYYYSLDDPNPLVLDKKCQPIYDASMYNKSLLTKVLTEANNMKKPAWMSIFNPAVIGTITMGTIVMMVVIGYFLTL